MTTLRRIQMHGIVFAPDANGGPGTPKFELDNELLNVTWQDVQSQSAQAAFSLLRTSKKLAQIEWNRDHVHLFRETNAGVVPVFTGKLQRPEVGLRDTICWCVDYKGYFAKSRSGWQTEYPAKLIGSEIVSPEFDAAKAADHSVVAFITKGTIQDPLGNDGITPIKTNDEFGTAMQNRLLLFYMLAELAMANTSNNVYWEVTKTAPHTFNFWKNGGSLSTKWAGIMPGTLADFTGDVGGGDTTNDLATPLYDTSGSDETVYQIDDATSIASYRRLQEAINVNTLVGITTTSVENDQQKAAMQRLLAENLRAVGMVAAYPRQGELDPFVGWTLGDTFRFAFQKGDRSGDLFVGALRAVAIAGAWTPDHGEQLVLYARTPK